MLKTSRLWVGCWAIVVAAGIAGCGEKPGVGPGQIIKSVGDRTVIATLDPAGDVAVEGDNIVVSGSGIKVTIAKDKVLIDGTDSGALPANAKRIDVSITGGTLSVNADDAPVVSKPVK